MLTKMSVAPEVMLVIDVAAKNHFSIQCSQTRVVNDP